MNKINWLVFTLSTLLLIPFSGCNSLGNPANPVTITFAFPESPDLKKYQALVDEFKELRPHVTIELRANPSGEIIRDEDSGVDAFIWWPDQSLSGEENPLIQSIGPLLKGSKSLSQTDFYPSSVEMFSWDGELWALPAEIDMQLLYFNKDHFDEGGASYPQSGWTWEDFLSTAQGMTKVTGEGYRTTGHYGLISNPRWGDYVPFIYQHGSDIYGWDDPRLAEAVQWYADLTRVHGVMPLPKYVNYGDTYGYFREGKAAMWIGFLADRDGLGFHHLNAPWPFDWGTVPLPVGPQEEATLYRGQGYYISSRCEDLDAAWSWIQFLNTHPLGKALPAHVSTAESDKYESLVGREVAEAANHAVEHLIPRVSEDGYPPDVLETYARTVESVVNDGDRFGFYAPPVYPREFGIIVEKVMTGEITAEGAVKDLKLTYGK